MSSFSSTAEPNFRDAFLSVHTVPTPVIRERGGVKEGPYGEHEAYRSASSATSVPGTVPTTTSNAALVSFVSCCARLLLDRVILTSVTPYEIPRSVAQ